MIKEIYLEDMYQILEIVQEIGNLLLVHFLFTLTNIYNTQPTKFQLNNNCKYQFYLILIMGLFLGIVIYIFTKHF